MVEVGWRPVKKQEAKSERQRLPVLEWMAPLTSLTGGGPL